MATSSPTAPTSASTRPWFCPTVWLKPFLNPYYFTVAAVLGGITVFFVVVTALIIIVATNFNVLGWIE